VNKVVSFVHSFPSESLTLNVKLYLEELSSSVGISRVPEVPGMTEMEEEVNVSVVELILAENSNDDDDDERSFTSSTKMRILYTELDVINFEETAE